MAEYSESSFDDTEQKSSNADAPEPMDADEVDSALHGMMSEAIEYDEQELSPAREKAAEYYKGEGFGDEKKGRSQFVSTDLRDVVKAIMPSLLRMFFGAEQVVEYAPIGEEDVEAAEQATQFMNDVVITQDNDGFLQYHAWFKDALVKREGVIKVWRDDSVETTTHCVYNADEEALQLLASDDEIKLTSIRPSALGNGLSTVEFTRTAKDARVRFECIPPEEFVRSRNSRSIKNAHLVAHRTQKTRSELIAMGIKAEDIDEWGSKDPALYYSVEEVQRRDGVQQEPESGPEATQMIGYAEAYALVDVNGDGIAELRKFCMLGPCHHVINGDGLGEPCNVRPFAYLCPDPEPHIIGGQGVSDDTMDIQYSKSHVIRAMFDSLALAIHPRVIFVEGEVSQADVLNTEMGAPIRANRLDAITSWAHEFVGQQAQPVIDYLDTVKEERTGMTRGSAGLDADALQSTTKAAVAAAVTAAQAQIEMIARIFAETGVKDLMKLLLQLYVEGQPKTRMVRLRNKWVQVDPRSWNAQMDVHIKVALGAGLVDEKIAVLTTVAEKQELIIQTLGPSNPLATMAQYGNTLKRMLELQGFKDTSRYFGDVPPDWQPPQPSQPDPNMMIAQAEQAKAQAEIAKKQAEVATEQQKIQLEVARRREELQLKREEMQLTDERERDRIEAEIALRTHELQLKYNSDITVAQIRAEIERDKAAAEGKLHLAIATHKAQIDADTKKETARIAAESKASESGSSKGDSGRTVRVVVAREKD